ncbi:MAG TPA: iron transporter [Pseudomonadales bacterium]|jgi:hypothetical protein|nr:iron transporter [Pseudomonadales bacterium]HNI37607.1 iron transporter [Pseudomonadales bacterium]HNN87463.1 iron transporter [Pseudomonadales bacterium]
MKRTAPFIAGAALLATAITAQALEFPIGKPAEQAGMEIAAVYLQPIRMEPEGMMRASEASDIHIEADIKALANNPNGFSESAWIPYLGIHYEITKEGGKTISGEMMPMVASDGPHYGDNVKLDGYGKYHLKYVISAPIDNPMGKHFGRHTDKETGVGAWFKPITLEWDFVYSGIGKKGGY